jgi:hypothetical protein
MPTVSRIAAISARVGSQPSSKPFVSPPGTRWVTMFASAYPAIPMSPVWAREIIPP